MLDTIYLQILDMSKTASIVILGVLSARLLLKKAPKVFSYGLWAIVLFRLLCPVGIEAPVSLVPEIPPTAEEYALKGEPINLAGAGEAAYQAIGDALNGGLGIQHIRTTQKDADGMTRYVSTNWWDVWILLGMQLWLPGMGIMLLYSGVTYWKIRHKLNLVVPLRENIYIADEIPSPFVIGIFRPRIYLPCNLNEQEQEYIILHEQYHIRRLDHWVKVLAFLALTIHWFNPLVWVAFILSSRDMEMSCDEAVIQKLGTNVRADYSASLLTLATGRRIIAGTPLAFGEGDPKGRIRNLANWKKPAGWMVLVSVILCIVLSVCLLTNPMENGDSQGVSFYYGIVVDRAMSKVNEGDREGRPYLTLRYEDGTDELFWLPKDYAESEDLMGQFVMVRATIESGSGLLVARNVSISDKVFRENLDDAIYQAVLDHNDSERYDGMFQTVSFVSLSQESQGVVSPESSSLQLVEKVKVFGIALHQVYRLEDGALVEEGGSHIPVVLSFTHDINGFHLMEYWIPRDGSYYAADIREKFPAELWPDTQKYIDRQQAECVAQAIEHYGLIAVPDWGISLTVENASPNGVTIRYTQSGGHPTGELFTGSYFVVQRYENGAWVSLEQIRDDIVWTMEAWGINKSGSGDWQENWTHVYGTLSPGHYRIGKEIMDFRGTGDYDEAIYYAEFDIE